MAQWKSSLLIFFLLIIGIQTRPTIHQPKLLIISFDGFRYDYFDTYKPPNFVKFAESGVRALRGMKPVFPSKTFPNHYSIVTGLYPESHGIVDNTFYDDAWDEIFSKKCNNESKWFTAAEPIWITGREQGLTTAACFRVGGEISLKNMTAHYFEPYNISVPWEQRVQMVVDWFDTKEVSFAALYFKEPDAAGHRSGSFSEDVEEKVYKLDETLGQLLNQLEQKNLRNEIDIILVSDHGMTNISQNAFENLILEDFSDDYIRVIQTGPVASIYPKKGRTIKLYNELNAVTPNVKVYLKNDIPKEFHYSNNRRIAPLIAIAKEGYQTLLTESDLTRVIGNHGYNNSLPSMWPIFMASGPNFKKGFVFEEQFENVNIYPLMCHILGIKPNVNNGSLENVRHLLDNAAEKVTGSSALFLIFWSLSLNFGKQFSFLFQLNF